MSTNRISRGVANTVLMCRQYRFHGARSTGGGGVIEAYGSPLNTGVRITRNFRKIRTGTKLIKLGINYRAVFQSVSLGKLFESQIGSIFELRCRPEEA